MVDLPYLSVTAERQEKNTEHIQIMKNLFMFETFSMINEMTFIFQGQAGSKWPLFKIY